MVTAHHTFDPEDHGLINLFEPHALESAATDLQGAQDLQPQQDLALLRQLLEIYDQKQIASKLMPGTKSAMLATRERTEEMPFACNFLMSGLR